jgi:hypothetical protein
MNCTSDNAGDFGEGSGGDFRYLLYAIAYMSGSGWASAVHEVQQSDAELQGREQDRRNGWLHKEQREEA